MIESWKKIVQTGFMQLELSQEELKGDIEELHQQNNDFGQKFDLEYKEVCNFQLR